MTRKFKTVAAVGLALYLAQIVAANWAIAHYGVVPVGFGLAAPAGVYFIGLGLVLRDQVHEQLGVAWAVGAIVAGAALSAALGGGVRVAIASGASFLLAEGLDLLVYIPARRKWGTPTGVLLSGIVGSAVDSWVFLTLAFGSLAFFPGQVVGKVTMTVIGAALLLGLRRVRLT